MPSVVIQIRCGEFCISSGSNINSRSRIDVTADNIQPMGPQLISHGLPNIGTINKNARIWIPPTIATRMKPNTTHESASVHAVGQGTLVGEAMGNYKIDYEIVRKKYKLQSERKNVERGQPRLDSTSVCAKPQAQKYQQQTHKHVKKNYENSTCQRTLIRTQICQTCRRTIPIHPKIPIINAEDVKRIIIIENARNRNLPKYA